MALTDATRTELRQLLLEVEQFGHNALYLDRYRLGRRRGAFRRRLEAIVERAIAEEPGTVAEAPARHGGTCDIAHQSTTGKWVGGDWVTDPGHRGPLFGED